MKRLCVMAALAAFLPVLANCNATTSAQRGGLSMSELGSSRPPGCPPNWCGCWARLEIGSSDKRLDSALQWPKVLPVVAGRGAAPVIGAWAVMGRKGGGHVGLVTGIDPDGNPIIKSGNHNHRVGEGVYPRARIRAYVRP